jgi:hypothetical protein
MLRNPIAGLTGCVSLALAACGGPSVRPDPARAIPASVIVLPAAPSPLAVDPSPPDPDDPPPHAIDGAAAARAVAAGLREGGVFALVHPAGGGADPEADYICEVSVRGRIDGESSPTWMAVPSTIVWFPTVFPAWWIPDRAYPGTEVEVRAVLTPNRKGALPILAATFRIAGPKLPFVDRGVPWQYLLSLVLPPFFMSDRERAREGLDDLVAARAGAAIPEDLRSDWPAAAVMSQPGCILILDPRGASIAVEDERADLRGWLGARKPPREVQVQDGQGRVLRRLDARTLEGLDVGGADGERPEAHAAWAAVEERFGPGGPRPERVYRLDLKGLPAPDRLEVLRVQAWIAEEPASFTVRLSRDQDGIR